MKKNNNTYYITISDKENGYGNQYRIIKESKNFQVQKLIFINNLPNWQSIDINPETIFNTIYDTIDYICNNIEFEQMNIKARKKILKR